MFTRPYWLPFRSTVYYLFPPGSLLPVISQMFWALLLLSLKSYTRPDHRVELVVRRWLNSFQGRASLNLISTFYAITSLASLPRRALQAYFLSGGCMLSSNPPPGHGSFIAVFNPTRSLASASARNQQGQHECRNCSTLEKAKNMLE